MNLLKLSRAAGFGTQYLVYDSCVGSELVTMGRMLPAVSRCD